jgi:hypothetical protein
MSTKKSPSAPDARSTTELRRKLASAENDARVAKNALKSAKQRAKETKRELKKARKALKRATQAKLNAKKDASKRKVAEPASAKEKPKQSSKEKAKPDRKGPPKEAAIKTRELGQKVANSPETRRRIRVKKSRPATTVQSSAAAPASVTDEEAKE